MGGPAITVVQHEMLLGVCFQFISARTAEGRIDELPDLHRPISAWTCSTQKPTVSGTRMTAMRADGS